MTISNFKALLATSFRQNKLKFVLKALIAFLSFVFLATMPIFTYRDNFNTYTNILAILVAVIYFVYFLLYGEFKLASFSLAMIVFIIDSFIVTICTTQNMSGWLSLFNILAISVVVFQAVQLFSQKWLFPLLIYFGCFVLALFVVADNFSEIIALDFTRIGGKFGDVNAIGLIFTVGIFFSIYLFNYFHNVYLKVFFALSIIPYFFLIFCTGSRGALLIAVCLLLVYLFLFCLRKKRLLLFFGLLVAIVGIGLLVLQIPVFADLKERFFGMFVALLSAGESGDGSASSRLYMMVEGLELWTRHPFFGNGNQAFRIISSQNAVSHSGLSELLCSYGLVGFILWHLPLIVAVFRYSKIKDKDFILTFAFGFVLPSLFPAIIYYAKMPMIAYAILMGLFNRDCLELGTYCEKRVVFNRLNIVYRKAALEYCSTCGKAEHNKSSIS